MTNDVFFCYSKLLHNQLQEKNIEYITQVDNKFWVYFRTNEVNEVINDYQLQTH